MIEDLDESSLLQNARFRRPEPQPLANDHDAASALLHLLLVTAAGQRRALRACLRADKLHLRDLGGLHVAFHKDLPCRGTELNVKFCSGTFPGAEQSATRFFGPSRTLWSPRFNVVDLLNAISTRCAFRTARLALAAPVTDWCCLRPTLTCECVAAWL